MSEHTTSYYAASANRYEPFPTLDESIGCDVCVVGGGYTGLSSALHLVLKWATMWCCWKARASASAPADATAVS